MPPLTKSAMLRGNLAYGNYSSGARQGITFLSLLQYGFTRLVLISQQRKIDRMVRSGLSHVSKNRFLKRAVPPALTKPHIPRYCLDATWKILEDFSMDINHALNPKELRSEPRKLLRCPAKVLFKDAPPVKGRTVDISLNGMCVMVPDNIAQGKLCGIAFQTVVNDVPLQVNAVAKAVYSICVGTEGFRVGFNFTELDSATKIAIAKIVD